MRNSIPRSLAFVTLTLVLIVAASSAQQDRSREGSGPAPLSGTPQILGTAEQRFRVVPLKGFVNPWALAFLPNGDMLITERPGRLRIVHNFVLDPEPIRGIPEVLQSGAAGPYRGLMDIALHPRFAENRLVYFTYTKPMPEPP